MTPPPTGPPDLASPAVGTAPAGDAPRYRVLATPHHGLVPTSGGTVPVGFRLEVTRVDAAWRRLAGDRAHAPLGEFRVGATEAGALDVAYARLAVVAYLVGRASPLPCRATTADVEVYLRLPDEPPADAASAAVGTAGSPTEEPP